MTCSFESPIRDPPADARDAAERPAAEEPSPGVSRLRALLLGARAGLVATVVMTAYRVPISASLPPTAAFWANYVAGGEPSDHPIAGLALHLVYGTAAGALFGATFPRRISGSEVTMERAGALRGTVFGLVLSVFGVRVLLEGLLGMDLEPDERWIFHVSHAVYGLTLGSWFGSRIG
jgi:hypothetical protein